jgi:hypothetical protein
VTEHAATNKSYKHLNLFPKYKIYPRREDNIKMDVQEVGCVGMNWIRWLRRETGGGDLLASQRICSLE